MSSVSATGNLATPIRQVKPQTTETIVETPPPPEAPPEAPTIAKERGEQVYQFYNRVRDAASSVGYTFQEAETYAEEQFRINGLSYAWGSTGGGGYHERLYRDYGNTFNYTSPGANQFQSEGQKKYAATQKARAITEVLQEKVTAYRIGSGIASKSEAEGFVIKTKEGIKAYSLGVGNYASKVLTSKMETYQEYKKQQEQQQTKEAILQEPKATPPISIFDITIPKNKSPEETIDYTIEIKNPNKTYKTTPVKDKYEPSIISLPKEGGYKFGETIEDFSVSEKILFYREQSNTILPILGLSIIIGVGKSVSETSLINPISGTPQVPYKNTPKAIIETITNPGAVYRSLGTTQGMGEFIGQIAYSSAVTYGISKSLVAIEKAKTSPPGGDLKAEGYIKYKYSNEPRYVKDEGIYRINTEKLSGEFTSYRYNLYSLKESNPQSYYFIVKGKGYSAITFQDLSNYAPESYTFITKKAFGNIYQTSIITNTYTGASKYFTYKGNKLIGSGEFVGQNEFIPTAEYTINKRTGSIYEVGDKGFSQLAEKSMRTEVVEYKGTSPNVKSYDIKSGTGIIEERIASSKNPYFMQRGTYTLSPEGVPEYTKTYVEITPAKFKFVPANEGVKSVETRFLKGGEFVEEIEPYFSTVQRNLVDTKIRGTIQYRPLTTTERLLASKKGSIGVSTGETIGKYDTTSVTSLGVKYNSPTLLQPNLMFQAEMKPFAIPLYFYSSKSESAIKPITESKPDIKPLESNAQTSKVKPVYDEIVVPKVDLVLVPEVVQIPKSETSTQTDTQTITEQIEIPVPKPPQPKPNIPMIPPEQIFTPSPFLKPPTFQERRGGSFMLSVRQKGKFVSRGVFENKLLAFSVGKGIIERTAAASFKIEQVGGQSVSPGEFNLGMSLGVSKRNPNVIIQKRSFRISSPGEKQEITSKGLFAIRQKKRRGGMFGL